MKKKQMKEAKAILIILTLGLHACATVEAPAPEREASVEAPAPEREAPMEAPAPDLPEWALIPPVEEGAIYGVGSDEEPRKAHLKSLTDIAWQMSTQVNSVSVERMTSGEEEKETLAATLGEQMTAATVVGAKIAEEYKTQAGETWVLSRKPLDCVLDVAESVLIAYTAELGVEGDEVATLIAEVEERLVTERVENPGLEEPTDVAKRMASIAVGLLEQPKRETLEEIKERVEASLRVEVPPDTEGFIYVEGGSFQMGSTEGESDEEPVHTVRVDSFYMGKYEVTHREFIEFLNSTGVSSSGQMHGNEVIDMDDEDVAIRHGSRFTFSGSEYASNIECPVIEVTWYGAVEYANWRSEQEGLTPVYRINGESVTADWNADGYRLPTEAEWEYAARGGNESKGYKYAGGNSPGSVGWYRDNSGNKTQPVGGKTPNELGLYDMSGNVYEWCWDWKGSYSSGSQTNPKGPSSGSNRVFRGGSCYSYAGYLRSADRVLYSPGYSFFLLGFRLVVRTP